MTNHRHEIGGRARESRSRGKTPPQPQAHLKIGSTLLLDVRESTHSEEQSGSRPLPHQRLVTSALNDHLAHSSIIGS